MNKKVEYFIDIGWVTLNFFDNPSVISAAKTEHLGRVGENFKYEPLLGDRKPPLDYRKIN